MERFNLVKSQNLPDWWVLTDTKNNIVVRFKEKFYNETQKVTTLDDDKDALEKIGGVQALARALREIGEWVVKYHGDIAFKQPYGWKYLSENELMLYRNKYPRWTLKLNEPTDNKDLATSLRKAAEYLTKVRSKQE